jgi:creatinine amidohydrolase/Fe(II)-dependent formamide hydrolase-like protein
MVMKKSLLLKLLVLGTFSLVGVAPGRGQGPSSPRKDEPRPIDAHPTLFMEDMTWMEVRDALAAGQTTVIVSTGGLEQNGPYLVTGKHNVVLRATSEAIARKLGNALVGPIISLVPEGDFDPPTGHMRYPGTIGLSQDTFKRVLVDVCSSLKANGFENLILIGDSGGNQAGMKEVAGELTTRWSGKPRVLFIPEYYDYPGLEKWLESQGIRQVSEGLHDDYGISSIMMTVDPTTVRMKERLARGRFRINGVDLSPPEKTIAMGKKAVDWRAEVTVAAIRKALGTAPSSDR